MRAKPLVFSLLLSLGIAGCASTPAPSSIQPIKSQYQVYDPEDLADQEDLEPTNGGKEEQNFKKPNLFLNLDPIFASWDTVSVLVHNEKRDTERLFVFDRQEIQEFEKSEGSFRIPMRLGKIKRGDYELVCSFWNAGQGGELVGEATNHCLLKRKKNEITQAVERCSPPCLTGFSAPSGKAGDQILLRGKGFSNNPHFNRVLLGETKVPILEVTEDGLVVAVPEVTPGTYPWKVWIGCRMCGRNGFKVE